MVIAHRKMTADAFLALPPNNGKWELIDGEIVVHDPTTRQQGIVGELFRLLANWVEDHTEAGEAGIGCNWRQSDGAVFCPDVWFVGRHHLQPGDRLFLDGAPDLAIEVRSPHTWHSDRTRKKDAYLALGAEVWLVDSVNDVVLVLRGDEQETVTRGETLTTPLMPGLAIDVGALFER